MAGQLKRARAFVSRFHHYDNESVLWVAQAGGLVNNLAIGDNVALLDVDIPEGTARAARRLLWQNIVMPGVIRHHRLNTYISFSHYLPMTLPASITTVIGVTNLLPFSEVAIAAERSLKKRLRLSVQKRTILSSVRRASRVIALSETCRQVLIEHGISREKIIVASNGAESPESNTVSAGASSVFSAIGELYVLYVSNFFTYKNFERLIAAYQRLPEHLQETFKLVLVGYPMDRDYVQVIQELVQRAPVGRIVVIPGVPISTLRKLYSRASVFIFPSLVETCPNILLEAMAHGTPVIASNIQPMPEFSGAAARYFNPTSTEDMSRVLALVLADEALRATMSQLSEERARLYTWDDFVRKVVETYRSA